MAFRVEFPPDIERNKQSSSRLSLPKNSGDTGDVITEGLIIAVKIASEVLGADIWLSFRDDFKPDDREPLVVFYADEIPILIQKTPEELREIRKLKVAFGPGSRVTK